MLTNSGRLLLNNKIRGTNLRTVGVLRRSVVRRSTKARLAIRRFATVFRAVPVITRRIVPPFLRGALLVPARGLLYSCVVGLFFSLND